MRSLHLKIAADAFKLATKNAAQTDFAFRCISVGAMTFGVMIFIMTTLSISTFFLWTLSITFISIECG